MLSSSEIYAKIQEYTKQKQIIDEKIVKLCNMILKLEPEVERMGEKESALEEIKPVYEDFISAEDYSYGTLIDYMVETAEAKQAIYNQFSVSVSTWINKFRKELERANLLLAEWQEQSEHLGIVIEELWQEYFKAVEMGL